EDRELGIEADTEQPAHVRAMTGAHDKGDAVRMNHPNPVRQIVDMSHHRNAHHGLLQVPAVSADDPDWCPVGVWPLNDSLGGAVAKIVEDDDEQTVPGTGRR